MAFYEYCQNNSGGSFHTDDKICHRVFIEAESTEEANSKAESLGIYFYGCDNGKDCNCCGDRWYPAWQPIDLLKYQVEGYEVTSYGENPEKSWRDKYSKYKIVETPMWKMEYSIKSFSGKIGFDDIEEYVQYLADEYGWTSPDGRIFYKDGKVTEIFSNKQGRR